jgi:hypothetical protein
MVREKSVKNVTAAVIIEAAIKTADTTMTDMADLMTADPAKFEELAKAVKVETDRLRKNQAVIKVVSGKNVNEKCWGTISAEAEVVDSGLLFVKGTKKSYDAKKEIVVDVVKYDAPAAVAVREGKTLATVDAEAVIEGDIMIAKYDSRMDKSTAHSTQLAQIARGIRDAKRAVHIKEQEAALAKKTAVRRTVAELGALLGFAPVTAPVV